MQLIETEQGQALAERLGIDVLELNPHAPRPFVFSELAACLCQSVQQAGHDCRHLINQRPGPGRVALVFVPAPGWEDFVSTLDRQRTVLINLEQFGSDSALIVNGHIDKLLSWPLADYITANVDYLRRTQVLKHAVCELPFVPGSAAIFRPELATEKSVDVLFFGSLNERRQRVLAQIEAAGLTVETVSGAYAWELTPAILRARLVLHVHFYETRLFPIARMLQPVANGVPVVCETSVHSRLSDWSQSGMVFAEYDALAAACVALLGSPQRQLDSAQRCLRFARQVDFDAAFKALLAGLAAQPSPVATRPTLEETVHAEALAEATQLPPESHLPAPRPFALAQRTPGTGRFGRLPVVLFLLFVVMSIWQSMKN